MATRDAETRLDTVTPSTLLVRVLLWGSLFVGTALLGRLSADTAGVLTLVAPSAGISVIWFTSGDRRTWVWDLAGMGLGILLVVFLAFPDHRLALLAVASTLLQVVTYAALLARLAPFYWSHRRDRPLSSPGDLLMMLISSIAAGLVGAFVGSINYTLVMGAPLLPDGAIRLGRNAVAIFVIAAVVGASPTRISTVRARWRSARATGISTRRLAELGWLCGATLVVFTVAFGATDGRPIGFLLLLPAIWVGMRFSPAVGAWFGLVCSVVVVVLTLAGHGVFTTIENPNTRAVVAQLLVGTLVAITLLLALTQEALRGALGALTERNEIVDAALGSIDEGFTIVDEDGTVLDRNPAVYQLVARRDLTGKVGPATTYNFFHPDGRPVVEGELPFQRAFRGETVEAEEVHLRLDGGSTRILEMTSRLLHTTDAHQRRRAFVLIRDVTRERQETQALTSFAGVVAHDLNGPLAAVTGWAGALLDRLEEGTALPSEEGLPMVQRVVNASDRMRVLIVDLLGYATARNKVPRPEAVDLTDVVRQTLQLRDAPDGVGPADVELLATDKVWADPLLLRQLVENLIGNAIKYVAPGERPHVVVTTRALPDGFVEVSLADNGLGIPAEERPLVFETFHRVQRDGYAGTGLGLAICKQIVEAHGGVIAADENPDGGTIMRFTLPGTAEALGTRHAAAPGR